MDNPIQSSKDDSCWLEKKLERIEKTRSAAPDDGCMSKTKPQATLGVPIGGTSTNAVGLLVLTLPLLLLNIKAVVLLGHLSSK